MRADRHWLSGNRVKVNRTVVRVRLDGKATSISLLVVLGIRRDGQKVLLAVRNMGGESEAAWRGLLDDLVSRGLQPPSFITLHQRIGPHQTDCLLQPRRAIDDAALRRRPRWLPERLRLCCSGRCLLLVAELVEIGEAASPAEPGYRFRQQGQCTERLALLPVFAIRPLCAW